MLMDIVVVLGSVPETGWYRTTEMYSLTVREARTLKPRYKQGHSLSDGFQGASIPAFA